MDRQSYLDAEAVCVDNAGIFDDVVGYGNGVNDNKSARVDGGFGGLPILDTPGFTTQEEATAGETIERTARNPEINPEDGFSRNYFLERLRNQHPFLQIDPRITDVRAYNILFSDPEVVVQIPPNARMYRVTWSNNGAATAFLAISRQRGISIAAVTSGFTDGVLVNPANSWRSCIGGGELVLKNFGTANRVYVSVEFFTQL